MASPEKWNRLARTMTLPAPLLGDAFSSPQQWNRYSCAGNNPLTFIDRSGRDKILVNYEKGAEGLGHAGIAVVFANGTVRYSEFTQVHEGNFMGKSIVNQPPIETKIEFDQNGMPVNLEALAQELERYRGAPPGSVRLLYKKTTEDETAALAEWMKKSKGAWEKKKYIAYGRNCGNYATEGYGRTEGTAMILNVPNAEFANYASAADAGFFGFRPHVTAQILNYYFGGPTDWFLVSVKKK